jgi:thiol-disulfide isomerase/thioredoxin
MGKAQRNRQSSARERIAAQQAAARRAEARRRFLIAGGAVVAVIAVVVALVVIKVVNDNNNSSGSSTDSAGGVYGTPLPTSVYKNVTTVPASALDSVGTGSVLSFNPKPVTPTTGAELTSAGKPEMLYIGAEFCPYCAAMRWSMAVALSRFGTLSPLHGIHSSGTDTDPNTPTLTFYKSTYTSKYLTFTPVENETRTHTTLQNTTSAQLAVWKKNEPSGELGYPFIDFGNKYVITGPLYDPATLAGLSWEQVSADLHNPSSAVAQGALGSANFITAAICKMTNGQPGSVCNSKGVTEAAAHFS